MKKNKAKRFNQKSSNKSDETKKNNKTLNIKNFLLFFIIIIIIVLIYITKTKNLLNFSDEEVSDSQNDILQDNAASLSEMLSELPSNSKYSKKTFDTAEYLEIDNLNLKYENNITIIKFNLFNNSSNNQEIFQFNFSLLDENNNVLISYDLSSDKIIEANKNKEFVLIATRDVSNAYDYKIELKK